MRIYVLGSAISRTRPLILLCRLYGNIVSIVSKNLPCKYLANTYQIPTNNEKYEEKFVNHFCRLCS